MNESNLAVGFGTLTGRPSSSSCDISSSSSSSISCDLAVYVAQDGVWLFLMLMGVGGPGYWHSRAGRCLLSGYVTFR
jgi:hypothetical protein